MPTDDISIGFKNIWYQEGFENAIEYPIEQGLEMIKILQAPYFIATKLEAFKGRGGNDGRLSKDFEDIIHILENRSTIWSELQNSNTSLKKYLADEFKLLLKNKNLPEWIDCHIERGINPATEAIIKEMKLFIEKY